jgi:hypothetical protein
MDKAHAKTILALGVLFVGAVLGLEVPARATPISYAERSDAADGGVQADGDLVNGTFVVVGGSGPSADRDGNATVYFFELPIDADDVSNADFEATVTSVNLSPGFDVHLYGLGYVVADSTTGPSLTASWYYDNDESDGADTRTDDALSTVIDNDAAVSIEKLQHEFLENTDGPATYHTDAAGDTALTGFLNTLVDEIRGDPNVAGNNVPYLVLRLSGDLDMTNVGTTRFLMGNSTDPEADQARLTFDYQAVIPEPGTAVLLLFGAGVLGAWRRFLLQRA